MVVVEPGTGRVLLVNDALCDWLGHPEDRLVDLHWSDLVAPGGAVASVASLESLVADSERSYGVRQEYVRSDAVVVWGELALSAVRNRDGGLSALVAQLVDVTSGVEETLRLAQVARRFSTIADTTSDVIWQVSTNRLVEYVSPSVLTVLGRSAADLEGTSILDLVHPDDVATLPVREVMDGDSVTFRARFHHADGGYRWLETRASAMRERGEVRGFINVMSDIDAQVSTERDLAEAEERYRLLAENSSDIVLRLTPTGVFEWVSGATEELLGWTSDDLVGRNKLELRHPDDLAVGANLLAPLLDGSVVTETDRIRTADGSYRWMNRRYRAILDDEGHPKYLVGSWRDAHKETEIREALEASERASRDLAERYERARNDALEANLAKTAFLSRMSHELRTPLNAVLGFAQLLAMDSLTPDQHASVEHIRTGGRHLLDLINEVLEISRIESGRLSLSLEDVLVADVLGEAAELVRSLASAADVTVSIPDPEEFRTHVWADRQRVIQILLNLMSNAVKYNVRGGDVTLRCWSEADTVSIAVQDTGAGISHDLRPRLFHAFDRLGAETSGVEGTGIGLVLSQGLAGAMGGSITLDPDVVDGARFVLSLPVARASAPRAATRPSSPKRYGGTRQLRVLCIEDNPANVSLMRQIMALRDNVELRVETNGRAGLDAALDDVPDLVFLDLHLPDLAGQDVLARIRADSRARDVVVVALTADASKSMRRELRDLGADGYLTKPVDVADVLRWVDDPVAMRDGT
jgi:PAS domain S-box-containing protein